MSTEHRPPCIDGNVCGESAHCPPADDALATPEALDALPVGSVVLDRTGLAWQRVEDHPMGHLWRAAEYTRSALSGQLAHGSSGPFTLHARPDRPSDLAAEELDELREKVAYLRSGAGKRTP